MGATSIALVGSLANDARHPENVLLRLTVAHTDDLPGYATLGRKLQGAVTHAGLNLAAVVFVADPEGELLGTLCRFRECDPMQRRACGAQVPGSPYLHQLEHWKPALLNELRQPTRFV